MGKISPKKASSTYTVYFESMLLGIKKNLMQSSPFIVTDVKEKSKRKGNKKKQIALSPVLLCHSDDLKIDFVWLIAGYKKPRIPHF